jgi:hypothetical protein
MLLTWVLQRKHILLHAVFFDFLHALPLSRLYAHDDGVRGRKHRTREENEDQILPRSVLAVDEFLLNQPEKYAICHYQVL